MKIYCLNGDPAYPCFVLAAKGCTVMLDCSLNMKTLQHFLPQMLVPNQRFENMPNFRLPTGTPIESTVEFNNRIYLNSPLEFSAPQFELINVEDIDAVLISNFNSMLALPFLTKLKGFRAHVYCTEPIMHLGKILMEELTNYVKNNKAASVSNETLSSQESMKKIQNIDETWKQYSSQLSQVFNITESHLKPNNWKSLYTKEDVDLCMSKIKLCDFNQRIDVFGSLIAQPHSSGYSLGSCNWSIESDCDKICYLSKSSALNTHSKLFNQQFLKQQIVDCLLLTGLNQAHLHEPEAMVQDFCKACIVTIQNKGNVLIPVLPTGKIYDLIECLYRYLGDANLVNIPVYFISPFANQSLAYSNIFAEWLCDSKQNLVYAAECPFLHGELVKSGFLKVYPSINAQFNEDFNQPCIVFASHPSLRFGEACHFVELWKSSPANSFIFIEPEFFYLDSLAPYQPIYANFYYFPIDTCLNTNQVHKMMKDTKSISQLVVSKQYKLTEQTIVTPADESSKIDAGRLNPATTVNYYSQNDIVKLSLKRKYENCDIDADLAGMIIPSRSSSNDKSDSLINNISYTMFNAELITRNNHHLLKAAPKTIPLTRRDRLNESTLKKYTYGKLPLQKFLTILRQSGLNNFKLNEKEDGNILNQVTDENTLNSKMYSVEIDKANFVDIDINCNRINVNCDNDDYRIKIKDSLLKCLSSL